MAFAAMFATLIGRFIVGMVVAACLGVALVVAGVRWMTEAADNPPELSGWEPDEDGAWTPVHGPRGRCWPCHYGDAA